MSGHSKWSTIKRKKGAADAKRGKIFSKIIKEITVAAKVGGADPNGNPRLRTIIDKARAANMPHDNIDRAIKKGAGALDDVNYEEIVYEGYGPSGVAIYMEILTDNKNRTVSELRHILSRNNGNLGESGSVAWIFEKKGCLRFPKEKFTEEVLMESVLEAGAEDLQDDGDFFLVTTSPEEYLNVRETLGKKRITPAESELTMIPKNEIQISGTDAEKMLKLMEALEDHDDIQNVYANFDISETELQDLS